MNIIKKYRALSFEDRTIFNARFSIMFNIGLAIGKIIFGILFNFMFLITAIVNICLMLSRLECYLGVKSTKRSFKFRNNFVGTVLILAGLQYTIYMLFLLFSKFETRTYTEIVAIMIAAVSFVELVVAIKGCFNSYGKGHYYRNIKMTNLCSAFTAIALTESTLMSLGDGSNNLLVNCSFGVVVGIIIILIGIYVFIAPMVSIVDRTHNVYQTTDDSNFIENKVYLKLTNSKFFGNYYYEACNISGIIDGNIVKEKNPLFSLNIFYKIIIIILSEILIFPYAVGAIIFHFKNATLIKKLDNLMIENGCIKLLEEECLNESSISC